MCWGILDEVMWVIWGSRQPIRTKTCGEDVPKCVLRDCREGLVDRVCSWIVLSRYVDEVCWYDKVVYAGTGTCPTPFSTNTAPNEMSCLVIHGNSFVLVHHFFVVVLRALMPSHGPVLPAGRRRGWEWGERKEGREGGRKGEWEGSCCVSCGDRIVMLLWLNGMVWTAC